MSRPSLFQVFCPRHQVRRSCAPTALKPHRFPLLGGCLAILLSLALSPGCRVHSGTRPPHISGSGLVRGHVALGIRDENQFLRFRASISPDSLVEFSLWKLLRFEVGLVGASVGVGPIDLGLGALLYDPDIPTMHSWGDDEDESMDMDESVEEECADDDLDDDLDEDDGWNKDDDGGGSSWRQADDRPEKVMQGF